MAKNNHFNSFHSKQTAPFDGYFAVSEVNGWRWLVFWFFWSLMISAVYWFLGSDSYLRIRDNAESDFSNHILAAKDFMAYGSTFWNPSLGGGIPSWISQEVDSLLMTIPFFFLPPWAAYGLIMELQRFIAGYFCYRLFQRLGSGQVASVFGGIVFSLNHWNVDDWTLYDGFGPPAIPLYLYLFDRLRVLPGKKTALILSGLLGMVVAIGGSAAHFTPFFLVFLPLWFLVIHKVSFKETLPLFIGFMGSAVLVEAPEVFALYSFFPDSTRVLVASSVEPNLSALSHTTWSYFRKEVSFPLSVFMAMSVVGAGVYRKDGGQFTRAFLLCLGFLLFQPVFYGLSFLFGSHMPNTGGSILDIRQFFFFTSVFVVTLGMNRILRAIKESTGIAVLWKNRFMFIVPAVAIFLVLLAWKDLAINLARRTHLDNYRALFENPTLKNLAEKTKGDKPFRVVTLSTNRATTASASGFNFSANYSLVYGFQTTDGFYHMYSKRLYQYWLQVVSGIVAERPFLKEDMKFFQYLYTPLSHQFDREVAMIPVVESEPIEFSAWYNLDLLSLSNTRFIFSHWPLRHSDLYLIHDPIEEKAVRKRWEQYRKREMVLGVLHGEPPPHALYIYENRAVLPRAFLVGRVMTFPNQAALLETLGKTSRVELSRTALVEQGELNDSSRFSIPLEHFRVDVHYPRPDRVVLKSEADRPSILVLTDNYDTHWRVWVDGKESRIFPVYHLYRGVALEQGVHEIKMEYIPAYRRLLGDETIAGG